MTLELRWDSVANFHFLDAAEPRLHDKTDFLSEGDQS